MATGPLTFAAWQDFVAQFIRVTIDYTSSGNSLARDRLNTHVETFVRNHDEMEDFLIRAREKLERVTRRSLPDDKRQRILEHLDAIEQQHQSELDAVIAQLPTPGRDALHEIVRLVE